MRLSPAPYRDAIIGAMASTGASLSRQWERWFALLETTLKSVTVKTVDVSLTAQSASIGATTILASAQSLTYRVTMWHRITQAATTSSSLAMGVQYTNGGIVCVRAGAADTSNVTDAVSTFNNSTIVVRPDPGTAIQYSTTYASVGATAMQYALYVVVEEMP